VASIVSKSRRPGVVVPDEGRAVRRSEERGEETRVDGEAIDEIHRPIWDRELHETQPVRERVEPCRLGIEADDRRGENPR
jgi:hypothetical protein